jgi:hypothetical protein
MFELGLLRKNKINLSDYNSQKEIENRILLADFTPLDLKVLEEIVFSPLKISFKKLALQLQVVEKELQPIVAKFANNGLLTRQGDLLLIDKEIRKSFEFEMQRFDPDFKPDMEFIQGLLRKVPIHLLPIWYSTPRSSNNLFESIVEKYLLTPQIFQRHLDDLYFSDITIRHIINDLFANENFTLSSTDVIAKYNLTRVRFEGILLLLEFHFVCTVRYIQEEDHWHEIVEPFYEWHEYLRATKLFYLDASRISRKKKPKSSGAQEALPDDIQKPLSQLPPGQWVSVDAFIERAIIPNNIDSLATLRKTGSHWKYNIPILSEEGKEKIYTSIVAILSKSDKVAMGTFDGRECFSVVR